MTMKKQLYFAVSCVAVLLATNGVARSQFTGRDTSRFTHSVVSRDARVSREAEQKLDYSYKYPCELLHDYHWDVEPNKDLNYYDENASALKALLNRLSSPIMMRDMSGTGIFSKELRESPVFKMSREEWNAFTTSFWAKYNRTFAPHFKRFVYDETVSSEDSDRALELYVGPLAALKGYDELVSLHIREVERLTEARVSGDEDSFARAERNLTLVDQCAFSFYARFHDVDMFLELNKEEKCDEGTKEEAQKFAELLVGALPYNQRLILECDSLYSFLARRVDRQLALDFRERITPLIDKKSGTSFVNRVYAHPEMERRLYLLESICPFNEAVLDVPMGETRDFYERKKREIANELRFTERSACSPEEFETVQRRVQHANNKIALFEALARENSRVFDYAVEQLPVDAFDLDPEDCEALQKRLDEEIKKPLDEIDERFVFVARLALLAREFYSTLGQGDDQIRAVGDKIIARALKSDGVAKKVVGFGQELEKRDPKLAKEFIDKAYQTFFDARTISEKTLQDCVRYSQELDEKIQ